LDELFRFMYGYGGPNPTGAERERLGLAPEPK